LFPKTPVICAMTQGIHVSLLDPSLPRKISLTDCKSSSPKVPNSTLSLKDVYNISGELYEMDVKKTMWEKGGMKTKFQTPCYNRDWSLHVSKDMIEVLHSIFPSLYKQGAESLWWWRVRKCFKCYLATGPEFYRWCSWLR
jgi:hypothetical protein